MCGQFTKNVLELVFFFFFLKKVLVVLEGKKKIKARKKIYCVLNIPQEKIDKKACQFKDRTDLLFFFI